MALTKTQVSQWNNPLKATPSIVQLDFGPYGQNLPGDGSEYCAPTSVVMGLYWLSGNGYTQLAPQTYTGQNDQAALNLERVIGGLMQTSLSGGTTGSEVMTGVATYLAACGIAADQYTATCSPNPHLAWITNQLAPTTLQIPTALRW